MENDVHIPLKYCGRVIYINAQHRRNILDKWITLKENCSSYELFSLMRQIFEGNNFDNPDIQFWSDYYKNLKGKYFKRIKYGDSIWIKPIDGFLPIYSTVGEKVFVHVQIFTKKDGYAIDERREVFEFSEIELIVKGSFSNC